MDSNHPAGTPVDGPARLRGPGVFGSVWIGLLLVLLLDFPTAKAETLRGRVVSIHDGDTITVLDTRNRPLKIRLHQIDAPELGASFGTRSRRALADLAFGREVTVVVAGQDQYGRLLGRIWLGALDVNLEQIRQGMAWAYRQYVTDPDYLVAENAARAARRGLWSQPNPMPPWQYRHGGRGRDAGAARPASPSAAPTTTCGKKPTCGQMADCAEARYYLRKCGNTSLDRDGDGVPCERLCQPH